MADLAALLHAEWTCRRGHDRVPYPCITLANILTNKGVTLAAPPSDPAAPLDVIRQSIAAEVKDRTALLDARLVALRKALLDILDICKPMGIHMSGQPYWFDGSTPAGGGSRERIWRICDEALATPAPKEADRG